MKKIFITIAILMTMGLCANAQFDAFVTWDDNELERYDDNGVIFNLPAMHGNAFDDQAPLGCGLLILTALGVGYAVKRNKKH